MLTGEQYFCMGMEPDKGLKYQKILALDLPSHPMWGSVCHLVWTDRRTESNTYTSW